MNRKYVFVLMLFVFCSKGNDYEKYAHHFADSTVVALVNEELITQDKIDASAMEMLNQRGAVETMSIEDSALQSQSLDWLITHTLLSQEVKNHVIEVKDREVEAALDLLKRNFPSDDEFLKAIASQNTSLRAIREDLVTNIKIQKLVQEQVSMDDIEISPADAQKYYSDHPDKFKKDVRIRVRHILKRLAEDAPEKEVVETRKSMEEIRSRIASGEDFATLARQQSHCPSAKKGGDLGFFEKGDMDETFEEAAFGLSLGDMSDVVRTKLGFHIIKLEDKKASEMRPFSEVEENIIAYLKQVRSEEAYQDYIDTLKEDAVIVLREDIEGE
ncbi:MAG: peptidylprolyl isomerase [candidate division KSB1 bacterium]|jgi:parvulin-like peptidyl-prolyl isomerase|nr:peptidylprolyl isomerase [candidate division KSB1 bacterium]